VFAVAIDQRAVTLEPDSFRTALSAVHRGTMKPWPNWPSPPAGRLESQESRTCLRGSQFADSLALNYTGTDIVGTAAT
jgi:hypothetical protein